MNSAELKRAKRDVRRRVVAERDAMPATARAGASLEIAQRFLALPEVVAARTVLAFWSFGSELSTTPLIERLHGSGTRVALPRIVDGELEAGDYSPGDPVTETSFGAFEPVAGAAIDPAAIDVVAVPAVAFDRAGWRVGYGGGFYDRFLPRTRTDTARIGLAFGVQLMAAGTTLPAGHFDLQVDLVVTESEVVRCRPAA
jgi:5-formyltetrahydrofolate cyclo-ligase